MTADVVTKERFEDCQKRASECRAEVSKDLAEMWKTINEFKKIIYRAQGGALFLQGLITLASSAGGLALWSFFQNLPTK